MVVVVHDVQPGGPLNAERRVRAHTPQSIPEKRGLSKKGTPSSHTKAGPIVIYNNTRSDRQICEKTFVWKNIYPQELCSHRFRSGPFVRRGALVYFGPPLLTGRLVRQGG